MPFDVMGINVDPAVVIYISKIPLCIDHHRSSPKTHKTSPDERLGHYSSVQSAE